MTQQENTPPTTEELTLIRAIHRNRPSRHDRVIEHVLDVEIRRRARAGAKKKLQPEDTKARSNQAARECRKRKKEKAKLKKALSADRKRLRFVEQSREVGAGDS